jgi:hypothetical protein
MKTKRSPIQSCLLAAALLALPAVVPVLSINSYSLVLRGFR